MLAMMQSFGSRSLAYSKLLHHSSGASLCFARHTRVIFSIRVGSEIRMSAKEVCCERCHLRQVGGLEALNRNRRHKQGRAAHKLCAVARESP